MSFIVSGNNEWASLLLIIGISMSAGFILVPYLYLRKLYQVQREELGIAVFHPLEFVIIGITLAALYLYLYGKGISSQVLILSTVQMFIVAVTEEFWARGAMCFVIRKLYNKTWFVVLLSSVCFAFVTHMNEPIMDNVLYRLPGSILMGIIYVKTNNLRYTILFHFTYNLMNI
ncbi:CPBP family intramembrane glutamic endopeptidase [Paenibacillus sp. TC-CSREp1]|uniref:CPBP family intramembrane glutamic endopeptidase n=1 Tax=Paenibacillus sp. TC-CSREp1 TaxID=3410089 RepID=UPI003D01F7D2